MERILITLACCLLMMPACKEASVNDRGAIKVTDMTYPVKNISVSINKSPEEVYQFASNPENFPKWVKFVQSITKQGDLWIGKTAQGDIKIKWPPSNDYGILDHDVTFANGETVSNPMRIIPNNKGCEFVFTLFHMPGKTSSAFDEDSKLVTADLQQLKEIMEKGQ